MVPRRTRLNLQHIYTLSNNLKQQTFCSGQFPSIV